MLVINYAVSNRNCNPYQHDNMLLVAGVLRDVKVNSTVSFSEHAQNLMLFATTRSFWDIELYESC